MFSDFSFEPKAFLPGIRNYSNNPSYVIPFFYFYLSAIFHLP